MQTSRSHIPFARTATPLLILVAVYLATYIALIWNADGLPYTVDNNETFSSLTHAHNMVNFDLSRSYGLTDESYATTEAGHPYIHSHQGNFPRIFAYFLYLFGAVTAESQIWLTTLTVGLAAAVLIFRFCARVGGPWFGLTVSLLLITDYPLFAQWHVNTYRVWHAFLFFSSLECIHLVSTKPRPWRLALGVLNFACLFYWEYVFGAFVGLMSAAYALALNGRHWRPLLASAGAIGLGGIAAAGTLLAQLTAYMGWDNVLKDIRYTLIARNSASDPVLAAEINAFFDSQNILFWQNFLDAGALRSWSVAWDGLWTYHWRFSAPELVMLAMMILGAWIIGGYGDWVAKERNPSRLGSWRNLGGVLRLGLLFGVVVGGVFVFAPLVSFGTTWDVPKPPLWVHGVIGVFVVAFIALKGTGTTLGAWVANLHPARLVGALAFQIVAFRAIAAWTDAYGIHAALPRLSQTLGDAGILSLVLVGSAYGFCLLLILAGPDRVAGPGANKAIFPGFLRFLVPCFLAFAVIYYVFAGYIYSGYLYRQAPFLVFPIRLVLSYPLLLVGRALRQGYTNYYPSLKLCFSDARRSTTSRSPAGVVVTRGIPLALGSIALIVASGVWLSVQLHWLAVAPPYQYRFLAQLREPPFKEKSFAVNTYAAPIAMSTGSWAYFESTLFNGMVELTEDGWQVHCDKKYLWFADRQTNPSYDWPDYAINIVQPDSLGQADTFRNLPTARSAETLGLYRRAKTPFQPFLRHEVVRGDGTNYAILKFDWQLPPFLQPYKQRVAMLQSTLSFTEKLRLLGAGRDASRRWRIEFEFESPPSMDVLESLRLASDGQTFEVEPGAVDALSLRAVATGSLLTLTLPKTETSIKVKVSVNDAYHAFDLSEIGLDGEQHVWTAAQPFGNYTRVPSFSPLHYVQTKAGRIQGAPFAALNYQYAHQLSEPEARSIIRVYFCGAQNRVELLKEMILIGPDLPLVELETFRWLNPDTVREHLYQQSLGDRRDYLDWLSAFLRENPEEINRQGIAVVAAMEERDPHSNAIFVPLPELEREGFFQMSVTPATKQKSGVEYFGLQFPSRLPHHEGIFDLLEISSKEKAISSSISYGKMKFLLRFPKNLIGGFEPILTTGSTEAGDFIYVRYDDNGHIRIGFDHWFAGGPVSGPIPVDYDALHELEISMGSLFPALDDLTFLGFSPQRADELKHTISVKLNGVSVVNYVGKCYESSPEQVSVGTNRIGGTSSGPDFTGEIICVERVWPALDK